jgi:hypothetical protein
MQRNHLAAAILLASFSLPAAALAQSMTPATTPPATTPAATPTATASAPTLPPAQEQKLQAHIKSLHDELKITPAEEADWAQFAAVMRANADDMAQAFNARANVANMTAPQNMQSYAQLAQVHADGMQKLSAAFQTLYDTFPASQKQIADAVFQNKMTKEKMKS